MAVAYTGSVSIGGNELVVISGTTYTRGIAFECGYTGFSTVSISQTSDWFYNSNYTLQWAGGIAPGLGVQNMNDIGQWRSGAIRMHGVKVFGGYDTTPTYSNKIQKYIAYTNQWASVNFLGTAMWAAAGASNYNETHFCSGYDYLSSVQTKLQKLAGDDTVTSVSNATYFNRAGAAACSDITNAVYSGGQTAANAYLNGSTKYTWSNGALAAGQTLTSYRQWHSGGCSIANKGYFAGGYDGQVGYVYLSTTDVCTLGSTGAMVAAAALSKTISYMAGSGNATHAVIAGGYNNGTSAAYNTVEKYLYSNNTKVAGAVNLGYSTNDHASSGYKDSGGTVYALFCGGDNVAGTYYNNTERYNIGSNVRAAVTVLDYALTYLAGAGSSEAGVTG